MLFWFYLTFGFLIQRPTILNLLENDVMIVQNLYLQMSAISGNDFLFIDEIIPKCKYLKHS